MQALTEDQVRAALVNASPEERDRLTVPMSFVLADWDHLDFFAWPDPDNRGRGYVVVERDGVPTGWCCARHPVPFARGDVQPLPHDAARQPGRPVHGAAAGDAGSAATASAPTSARISDATRTCGLAAARAERGARERRPPHRRHAPRRGLRRARRGARLTSDAPGGVFCTGARRVRW
jgi:hypothetical protein